MNKILLISLVVIYLTHAAPTDNLLNISYVVKVNTGWKNNYGNSYGEEKREEMKKSGEDIETLIIIFIAY